MFAIKEISKAAQVFPTTIEGFIPPYENIPVEFKDPNNPWVRLQAKWFFNGLRGYTFKPREGVDADAAILHCSYVQGSWEPKHEHKEVGVAFLLHEWFEDVRDPNGNSVIKEG